MDADRRLTQFQRDCESAVMVALGAVGLTFASRELLGENETYIRANVSRTGIVLYIYEDEAEVHDQEGLFGLYEAQDYPSGSELQRAFVTAVVGAVGNRLPAN